MAKEIPDEPAVPTGVRIAAFAGMPGMGRDEDGLDARPGLRAGSI